MSLQMTPILLAIIACVFLRARRKSAPASSLPLKGWQKIFGALALIVAILMVLNPEFLALGLLGDTAFFDVLVLCLSLQFQMLAVRAWRSMNAALSRTLRAVGIPSPTFSYLVAVCIIAIGSAASTIQKVVHRISS